MDDVQVMTARPGSDFDPSLSNWTDGEDTANNDEIHPKYWSQRYRLWSKFDDGVWMTPHGWETVSIERFAGSIAETCASRLRRRGGTHTTGAAKRPLVALDAFSGVGGSTVQLARHFDLVIGVERDPEANIACRHNAEVYGVADKILLVEADYFEFCRQLVLQQSADANDVSHGEHVSSPLVASIADMLAEIKALRKEAKDDVGRRPVFDVVHMSPPWGGQDYFVHPIYHVLPSPEYCSQIPVDHVGGVEDENDVLCGNQATNGAPFVNLPLLLQVALDPLIAENLAVYLPRNVLEGEIATAMSRVGSRTDRFYMECVCHVLNDRRKAISLLIGPSIDSPDDVEVPEIADGGISTVPLSPMLRQVPKAAETSRRKRPRSES